MIVRLQEYTGDVALLQEPVLSQLMGPVLTGKGAARNVKRQSRMANSQANRQAEDLP